MATTGATQVPLLNVQQLRRVVNGKVILEDISFELRAGEILAILGPSGSGKSSLLRLLNRLDEPSGGSVLLEGRDYRSFASQQLRRKIALVMQRPYLFPGTVGDNLSFGPKQRGVTLEPSRVEATLREVGLGGYAGRDTAKLSGGEAQRVSLARALANEPLVLLLDEPTSALDDASKNGIEVLIRNLIYQKRLGCLLVTHERAQADRLADRVLHIKDGAVIPGDGPC
jgi:putative ABC transport system ATP-binding protein